MFQLKLNMKLQIKNSLITKPYDVKSVLLISQVSKVPCPLNQTCSDAHVLSCFPGSSGIQYTHPEPSDTSDEIMQDVHYKLVSKGVYACLVCGYKANRGNVVKHYLRRHLQFRNFSCTFCDKNFKSEENRRGHIITKHGMKLTLSEIRHLDRKPNDSILSLS